MTLKRTAIARNPEKLREWEKRSRGDIGSRPKSNPRRARHPFPLPTGSPIVEADVVTELLAFGPQAELCRRTRCAACWWVAADGLRGARVDWTLLPEVGPGTSEAHHEPHRSTRGDSLDRDTIPLCAAHHRTGNGDTVRHLLRSDAIDSRRFYELLPFDWRAVVAEMRRRTALTRTP